MSKRRAGHTLAIIVGLLMAGIRPSAAGGEETIAAARIEAMANLLAKAQLFATDFPQKLKDILPSARLVGKETVGGVATDHVAFRGDTADVQFWIARAGDPLPQRVVITYRLAEGQPQFEGDFHGWTFTPDVSDSVFTFVPAAGEERIPILTPGRGRASGEKQP